MNIEDLQDAEQYILINGDKVTIADGANVIDVLREETRRRGITTFCAYVNGRELNSPDEIRDAFNAAEVVEVRTYSKPGRN